MKRVPSFEELQQPLPLYSFKGLYYAAVRLFLRTIGNLSDGIRIGNTFGYDSGVMLDYVYKKQPSGRLWIGRLIDTLYLNTAGWRGIRARNALLQDTLTRVVRSQLEKRDSIRYLDMACVGGEYDIAVLKRFDPARVSAELRDYKRENIEKAAENARTQGLRNIRFKQADAFDPRNFEDEWDIIVASGFWEIIADDGLVKGCLLNAARCLDPGAALVFTIQPYHPDLELIARTLVSHAGRPWIMRLRSLERFKEWLQEGSLTYVAHRMEPQGIFGVVEALRV